MRPNRSLEKVVRIVGFRFLRAAIAVVAVVATIAAIFLEFGVWTRTVTLQGPFLADGGHAFRIDLGPGPFLRSLLSTGGDGPRNYSRLRLFEDGIELTQGHTAHQLIRDGGGGRFRHWHEELYFSATDNSDPNVSGHVYSAVHPLTVQLWVWGLLAASLLISLRLYRRESSAILDKIQVWLLGGQSGWTAIAIPLLLFAFFVAVPVAVVVIQLGSGRTTSQTIGGLLPWSDSGAWLQGSLRLLLFGEASEWASRRPLNTAFFASILGAAGQDLVGALLVRAALLGATVYLFFRVTARSFGVAAALAGACIVFGFAYLFVGVTLSETNGLILGTLGISILLHATHARSSGWFGLGLFLLAVGLLMRSGPFLVLPALVVWSAFAFSRDRRVAVRPLLIGIGAVAGAWLLSKGVAYAYMPLGASDNANFSYVFYGLAKGGEPWQSFFDDIRAAGPQHYVGHAESDLAREAYGRAFDLIIADPIPLLRGMFGFALHFLRELGIYAPPGGRVVLLIIAAAGLLSAIFSRGRPERRLPLVGFIGCVASASVIYWSVDAHRAFAATIAFDALFVALGVCALLKIVVGTVLVKENEEPAPASAGVPGFSAATAAGLLGVSLVAFTLLGPAVLRADAVPVAAGSVAGCSADEREITVRLGRSSTYIHLTDRHDAFAPEVNYGEFQSDPGFAGNRFGEVLKSLRVGDVFMFAIDLGSPGGDEHLWARAGSGLNLADGKLYRLCMRHIAADGTGDAPDLYEAVTAREIKE
jgi:hypothetical protein